MKIEHAALYVNDLEAAKDFFVRYLDAVPNEGYHNPRTDFRSYFLTFSSSQFRVSTTIFFISSKVMVSFSFYLVCVVILCLIRANHLRLFS